MPCGCGDRAGGDRVKYAGYIDKQKEDVERAAALRTPDACPTTWTTAQVHALSFEVRQKLTGTGRQTLGQASRISGVTPAAISLLLIHLKKGQSAQGDPCGRQTRMRRRLASGHLSGPATEGLRCNATPALHCAAQRSALLGRPGGPSACPTWPAAALEPGLQPDRRPRADEGRCCASIWLDSLAALLAPLDGPGCRSPARTILDVGSGGRPARRGAGADALPELGR